MQETAEGLSLDAAVDPLLTDHDTVEPEKACSKRARGGEC